MGDAPPEFDAPHGAAHSRNGIAAALHGPEWRFVCLAEIANFHVLRRIVGRARSERLVEGLLRRAASVIPHARFAAIDRKTVEIAFTGERRAEIDHVLADLLACVAEPVDIDGELHVFEVALGAAAGRAPHVDELRLIEEAEASLAEGRVHRRASVREAGMGDDAVGRAALARALPLAISRGELRLQYQPKLHLRRQEVAGAEALIRWEHPEHGMILPGDFIPVAEDANLIGAMTMWTIRQVLADRQQLNAHDHDPTIFVNISGQLLSDAAFVQDACAELASAGGKIGFEITETSVIRDPDSAIRNLKTFADIGIAIAIDDYGAGLSSLAYLKQLPARELKIDKLFVTQLASSNRDPLIVRSTIDLAHALEMEVVAEGVESQAALALLTVMGCDMAQGFLISRPVALDALIRFLDDDRHRAPVQGSTRFPLLGRASARQA